MKATQCTVSGHCSVFLSPCLHLKVSLIYYASCPTMTFLKFWCCQIPEFIDLKRRLDLSLHFATVNYENMLLDVFTKANRL